MDAYDLAAAFSVGLREELSPWQFEEALRLNGVEADPQVCHSHDFCDANMVMLEALEALGGTFSASDEQQAALISEAWNIAKRCAFDVK